MNTEPHEVHQAPYIPETQEVALTQVQESRSETHLSPLDVAPEVFKAGLDRRRQNHKALIDWVRSSLVRDTDFGKIHVKKKSECDKGRWCKDPTHFSKDVLFKPGAEKIVAMLGVTPRFPTIKDYENAAVSGVAVETIILRCELVDSYGNVVAEGVGARSVAKEYGDTNKALKMAEKSAHIDATLRLAGLSEVFTQDLEDMEDLTSTLEASIEAVKAKKAETQANVSPEVQEMLQKAKANREREQAKLDERGPVDRAKLKREGFPVSEDPDPPEKCKKCGGDMVTNATGTVIQCEAGREEWFSLQRAGKTPAEASAMTKGHSFRKLKK